MRMLVACGALLIGCGGGGGSDDDAGGGGDAAGSSVTVTVWADGEVAAGMAVMVHDSDGGFVRTVMTDAGGVATVEGFPAGGAVTVPTDAFGRPVVGYLTTITDVQPGDDLTIGKTPISRPADSAGMLSVSFGSTLGGATQYQVRAGCNEEAAADAGDTVLVSLRQVCVVDGEVDVVGYGTNIDGDRIGYASAAEVGIATANVPLPNFQTDLATWSVDATGAPADMGVEGFYQGFRRGIPVDEAIDAGGDIAAAGEQSFDWKLAPAFFSEAAAGVHVRYGDGTVDRAAIATLAQRIDELPAGGASATLAIDLAADLFPEVSEVALTDTTPLGVSYSAADTLVCGAETPDAAIWMVVGTSPPAVAAGANVITTWLLLSAGELASGRQLPELDPELAADLWPEAAFTSSDAGIMWIADTSADYADIRGAEANFAVAQYAPNAAGTRCLLRAGRFGASARP